MDIGKCKKSLIKRGYWPTYAINEQFRVKVGDMSSGGGLFGVTNVLQILTKKRKINRYGYSTTATKNKQKRVLRKSRKEIQIVIWATISDGGHTEIYRMNRDKKSGQRVYSARSYLQIKPSTRLPACLDISANQFHKH